MLKTRALASVFTLILASACREQPRPVADTPPAPLVPPASTSSRPALTRVTASSEVCMVNDQHMGREQIPVQVSGRTYYGCCAGCKDKLQNSAAARTGTDPVTRKPVDKAVAVIARTEAGKVFYFESGDTLERYARAER